MKRLALLLGTLALASAFHSRAQAQASTQAIQPPLEVRRDGEQVQNAQEVYGTLEDCDNNAEFEFGMDFAAPVPIWEAWLGVGSVNCASVMSRTTSSASATNPVCKLLATNSDATARPRVSVRARDMFSKDWGAKLCDEASKQLYTVYLLPLNQETSLGSNTASEVISIGAYSTRTATFTLYTKPPNRPNNVKGISGESRIGVKFDVITGAQPRTQYRAYFDWGTGGSGECGSGILDGDGSDSETDVDAGTAMDAGATADAEAGIDAGAEPDAQADTDAEPEPEAAAEEPSDDEGVRPPPDDTPNMQTVTVTGGEAYLEDLDRRGIGLNEWVAVSVVTVDPAENESALTTPICVQRVETVSFSDNCKEDPECKDGFTTCSMSPGEQRGGLIGLGSLLALAAGLVLRRRRHV
jgi:hypothetical protein